MSGPANPWVDKVSPAAGSSKATPLALASRETISETWISPVLPMGISIVRVSIALADAVPTSTPIHNKWFIVLVCIAKQSDLGRKRDSTAAL